MLTWYPLRFLDTTKKKIVNIFFSEIQIKIIFYLSNYTDQKKAFKSLETQKL